MEELDLLKSHWQKDNIKEKQLSSKEIYPLLLKKSSSIVKTLFYISIAELVFWIIANSLPLFMSDSYVDSLNSIYGNGFFLKFLTFFSYTIIILFVYLLYKSYKSISVTDNSKKLMESILKTRQIIKYYVIYNLTMAFVTMVILFYFAISRNSELMAKLNNADTINLMLLIGIGVAVTAGFVFIIWLFYRLIYGILLKRLNKNYRELKKLEM